MKAWPPGVIVVPTVPTTASQYAGATLRWGITRLTAAVLQSGLARKADRMYAPEMTAPTAMKRYCTLLKLPFQISRTIRIAAVTALTGSGTPKSSDPGASRQRSRWGQVGRRSGHDGALERAGRD